MRKSTKILVLLSVTIIIFSFLFSLNKNGDLFIEDANFGEMIGERKYPLTLKNDDKLKLDIESKIEKGDIIVSILSPDGKVVYKKRGNNLNEHATINITKGVWYISLGFDGGIGNESSSAKNGSYKVVLNPE